ncbi:hypothetical protein ACJJTC_012336 [Scirpophaga incertulas]
MFSDIDMMGFPGVAPYRRTNEFAITAEGFIPLCEKEYDVIASNQPYFAKSVAKSAWVYYCVMGLYARLITLRQEDGSSNYDEDSFASQTISCTLSNKGDVLKDEGARNEILARWDAIGRGRDTGLPDTAAFFRAQVVTLDKNKIRGVWGVPLDVISEEARFFLLFLCLLILLRLLFYETTGYLPLGEMYLGDDSFVICDGKINLSDISIIARDEFGMILHPDKSYVTDNPMNVQFLGYYNRRGLPYKGHAFLIASFIYPERYVKTPLIRTARAIGQMWSTMHSGMAAPWHRLVQHMSSHKSRR